MRVRGGKRENFHPSQKNFADICIVKMNAKDYMKKEIFYFLAHKECKQKFNLRFAVNKYNFHFVKNEIGERKKNKLKK
jgi:hypothetical protein